MSARYEMRYYRLKATTADGRPFEIIDGARVVFTFKSNDRKGCFETLDRLNGVDGDLNVDLHPAARAVLLDHGIDLPDEAAA